MTTRKAAAVTAAVDAIEGEPGGYVTWPTRRHLEALYDRAVSDQRPATGERTPMNAPPYEDIAEITDLVTAAADKMRAAARDLQAAADAARDLGAPRWFPGQLEAYTIPILRRFADRGDPGQPGNLPRLLANLQGDDDAP